jgi:hypothetical protein
VKVEDKNHLLILLGEISLHFVIIEQIKPYAAFQIVEESDPHGMIMVEAEPRRLLVEVVIDFDACLLGGGEQIRPKRYGTVEKGKIVIRARGKVSDSFIPSVIEPTVRMAVE